MSDLDPLRTKLVSQIDTLNSLLHLLHSYSLSSPTPSSSAPGLPGWEEIMGRFHLLLVHLIGLGALVSGEGEAQRGGGTRDVRREKWDGLVVVPQVPVEESRDWLVGTLLRTKQVPEVEAHLEHLLATLPPSFRDPATYAEVHKDHTELTGLAVKKIRELKEGMGGEDWDWKARVDLDEEDEEGGDVPLKKPTGGTGKKWSVADVVRFQKTGMLPL